MKRLQGKKALITGGSSGIGRAIAIAYAKEGADVVLTYKSNKSAACDVVNSIEEMGQIGRALHWDSSQLDSIPHLIDEANKTLGFLNILVNNVGIVKRTAFIDIELEQLQSVLSTNFTAPFLLIQNFCRNLIRDNQQGRIINISSLSAQSAISQLADYQSSKAALSMLTKSVAYEMAKHKIGVNTISPGLTRTTGNRSHWEGSPDIWKTRTSHIPLGCAGEPEDHVGAAIYLASDESRWVTGADIVIDGGQSTV